MGIFRSLHHKSIQLAFAALFLLLIPLHDTRSGTAQTAFDHAWKLFEQGRLADSQQEAEQGYKRFRSSNPEWAAKFQLLEAENMVWRGMYDDALRRLSEVPISNTPELTIGKLALEGVIFTHQQQFSTANQRLVLAESFCDRAEYLACGDVLRARGILANRQGQVKEARISFLKASAFAHAHHDRLLEASAALNLGWAALHGDHFDESVDWSLKAYRTSIELGAEDKVQITSGNLGWAYYQLGDDERALNLFLAAKKSAAELGNLRYELKWTTAVGYVYHDTNDPTRAAQSYRQALDLAKQINSKEDIAYALADLAQISVETGKLDDASAYLDQITQIESLGGNRLSPQILLTKGMLAAARHQDQQAETLFRAVQNVPANSTTTRLGAGRELALLFERQGKTSEAEKIYKATLATFDSARAQLKHEDSRLPFAANAMGIYGDYVHMLVTEGRSEDALAVADQSRARTLAQGLGEAASKSAVHPAALNPRQIAQRSGATLLFYWLGDKQSYLWTITPAKVELTLLPAEKEIAARVTRYRKALLDGEDPLRDGNEDGQELYKLLVAPAAKLIRPNATVMILADSALSQLNFETLLAPGPRTHYWIEDATVLSAPSLDLLAASRPAQAFRPVGDGARKLLMLGNPVTPSADYPSLPLFGAEMTQIARHFTARQEAVFAGDRATPAAYLASNPGQYAYIHFVSHATASRTDPLDSAIILSGSSLGSDQASGSSFKLYARDIMQHPIQARLVTISACYGSGSRAYEGEGLVGLSWAFLRAGSQSVIGAMWEVSDESTPRLMDALYQGMQEGQAPAIALRNAKLGLLHSQSKFRAPFYWAPFQIYTRR